MHTSQHLSDMWQQPPGLSPRRTERAPVGADLSAFGQREPVQARISTTISIAMRVRGRDCFALDNSRPKAEGRRMVFSRWQKGRGGQGPPNRALLLVLPLPPEPNRSSDSFITFAQHQSTHKHTPRVPSSRQSSTSLLLTHSAPALLVERGVSRMVSLMALAKGARWYCMSPTGPGVYVHARPGSSARPSGVGCVCSWSAPANEFHRKKIQDIQKENKWPCWAS